MKGKFNLLRMKLLKRLIRLIIVIIIVFATILIDRGYRMYEDAINSTSIEDKIAEIKSISNYTTYENLPKDYVNAVVAVEDKRFFKHNGVDIISIGRAVYVDIVNKELVEGGSTITQQLAKNIYFNQDKKLTRKIAEAIMAVQIEKVCTKEEIFELYVNTSYFGDGYYCVGDASKGYFDKSPNEMNLYECTLLAGIPNAPSVYAPTKNPELAKERQAQVLKKMVEQKYITQEQSDLIQTGNY